MQKTGTSCAIGRDNSNGSCFNIDELKSIATDYNEKHSKNRIIISNDKEDMIKKLKDVLQKECSDQTCWPTLKFIKNKEELQEAFKPDGPAGQYDWLSTTEINEGMERYIDLFPEFLFIGAVPIDIEDLDQFGVKNLNYNKLAKKGKTKIGIVYNLDEHYKSGSHWVSFYIDTANKKIFYSDSAGRPPEQRIKRLVKKLAESWYEKDVGKKINLPLNSYMNESGQNIIEQKYNIKFNETQHQYGGSECGIYAMNFIIRLIRGDDFDDIHKSRITDKEMNQCRKIYFNGYDNIIKNKGNINIC
jgi:hypothetical protein